MANANQLLTENITDWKDVGEIQNQVTLAQYGARSGLYTIEWNVAAQMDINGDSGSLTAGTYQLKAPQTETNANIHNFDDFFIPAGTLCISLWVHTHVARANGTSVTPNFGGDTITAISTAGAADRVADLSANLFAANADFNVVTVGAVTAAAFTIFLEYYIANV